MEIPMSISDHTMSVFSSIRKLERDRNHRQFNLNVG